MTDAICFEFSSHNTPDKNTFIPQKSDPEYAEVAENVSFASMTCGCCYSVCLPIRYEYNYREWLEIHGIVPKETKYISNRHNETKNWIYLDSEQKKFTALLNELLDSEQNTTELLNRDWTVKYHLANEPNKVLIFTKDVQRVS